MEAGALFCDQDGHAERGSAAQLMQSGKYVSKVLRLALNKEYIGAY